MPAPTPTSVEAVNYEQLLPDTSPMLCLLANHKLILALDAADNKKHMFLPMLAIEANAKKCYGNFNVRISMKMEMLSATCAMNRHFLMSSSKF